MVDIGVQMDIKEAVVDYLQEERKETKVGNFPLHEILGIAETIYFERVQLGLGWYEASEEAEEYVTNKSKNTYEIVRSKSDKEVIKDDGLVEEVQLEIGNQLRIRFREDRQRFESIIGWKPLPREKMYVSYLKDLIGLLPSHVYTDFILEKDIQLFVKRVHEAYLTTDDREKRTSTYFKLMYTTLEDPLIYSPVDSNNIDWEKLKITVFKYIIGDRRLRDTINVSLTTHDYYDNIRKWNENNNHNKRDEQDFKKSYIGSLVVNNNIYPKANKTKALADTLQRLFKVKFETEEGSSDIRGYVAEVNRQLRDTGAGIIKVKNIIFIVGKELIVVEDTGDGLKVRTRLAYSNVTNKDIEKYVK